MEQVICLVVRRDTVAVKFRVYFSFILLAESLTSEEGEETEVPRENPWWQASQNATY